MAAMARRCIAYNRRMSREIYLVILGYNVSVEAAHLVGGYP